MPASEDVVTMKLVTEWLSLGPGTDNTMEVLAIVASYHSLGFRWGINLTPGDRAGSAENPLIPIPR